MIYVTLAIPRIGGTMRTCLIAAVVTGLFAPAAGLFFSDTVRAQSDSAKPAEAASAAPIGEVVSVSGSVTIEHAPGTAVVVQASVGQPNHVKIKDKVFLGDVVATGPDGKLAITFNDGTSFTLSSSARMELNQFVYDPNGKSNSTLFNLTKGTFTFVAGKIAKTGDMKIDTPVATMGIRGTTPHVEISEDGSVRFSTLIEEGKDKVMGKGAGNKQGRSAAAKRPSNVRWEPAQENHKPNLTICGSC